MLKAILFASLTMLLVLNGTATAAGKKKSAIPEKTINIIFEKSKLRCWQQGKLLFSEEDWHSFTIANKENVLNFTNETNSNQTLSLINMGDTVCLYKKQDK